MKFNKYIHTIFISIREVPFLICTFFAVFFPIFPRKSQGINFASHGSRSRRINGALALFEALATSKEGSNLVGRRAVLKRDETGTMAIRKICVSNSNYSQAIVEVGGEVSIFFKEMLFWYLQSCNFWSEIWLKFTEIQSDCVWPTTGPGLKWRWKRVWKSFSTFAWNLESLSVLAWMILSSASSIAVGDSPMFFQEV